MAPTMNMNRVDKGFVVPQSFVILTKVWYRSLTDTLRDYLAVLERGKIIGKMFVCLCLNHKAYLSPSSALPLPGFCLMVCLSVYTDHFHRGETDGWYGYSYILAWLAWLLALLTGVLYIILKKKIE